MRITCNKGDFAHGTALNEIVKECIGEFVKYNWGTKRNKDAYCENAAGTCARALCECDLDFAKKVTKIQISKKSS